MHRNYGRRECVRIQAKPSEMMSFESTTSQIRQKVLRWPGIVPGATAWKAAMLTGIPPTLVNSFHL